MGTKNQKPKFKTIKLSLEEDNPIVGDPTIAEPTRIPAPTRTFPEHRRHAPEAIQVTKFCADYHPIHHHLRPRKNKSLKAELQRTIDYYSAL